MRVSTSVNYTVYWMSTGVIRSALSSVLEDEGFGLNTPRLKLAKEIARKILDLRVDQQETFDVFSATLTAKVKAAIETTA